MKFHYHPDQKVIVRAGASTQLGMITDALSKVFPEATKIPAMSYATASAPEPCSITQEDTFMTLTELAKSIHRQKIRPDHVLADEAEYREAAEWAFEVFGLRDHTCATSPTDTSPIFVENLPYASLCTLISWADDGEIKTLFNRAQEATAREHALVLERFETDETLNSHEHGGLTSQAFYQILSIYVSYLHQSYSLDQANKIAGAKEDARVKPKWTGKPRKADDYSAFERIDRIGTRNRFGTVRPSESARKNQSVWARMVDRLDEVREYVVPENKKLFNYHMVRHINHFDTQVELLRNVRDVDAFLTGVEPQFVWSAIAAAGPVEDMSPANKVMYEMLLDMYISAAIFDNVGGASAELFLTAFENASVEDPVKKSIAARARARRTLFNTGNTGSDWRMNLPQELRFDRLTK